MENKKIDYASRFLIRSSQKSFLATELSSVNKKKVNFKYPKSSVPYSTFVMSATDYDGSPLLLLSDLSEHTKNLEYNDIISLLFYEEQKDINLFPEFDNKKLIQSYEDPMSRPRITVIGKLEISKNKNHKRRFSSRHPASNLYSNFKDMNIYKLNIISGHVTAGFAKVKWFKREDLILNGFSDFENDEHDIIDHMNDAHQESINLFEKFLFTSKSIKGNWKIIGLDPEGFDIRLNDIVKRYNFKSIVKKTSMFRKIFINLHKLAKEKSQ